MKRLVFTDQAEADLEAIGDYIALDSPFRAVTFIQELRRDCVELRTMPERYPFFERHRSSSIRRRVHGNYLIFYRASADTVEILHILHGGMDLGAILFLTIDGATLRDQPKFFGMVCVEFDRNLLYGMTPSRLLWRFHRDLRQA